MYIRSFLLSLRLHFLSALVTELSRIKTGPWNLPLTIEGVRFIRCQMGPAGPLDRGYSALTGRQTNGLVWWCNGLMSPEIIVERGVNYSFYVDGGDDWHQSDKFNPFYITDDPRGGLMLLPPNAKKPTVFAGVRWNQYGHPIPTVAGRYCEWRQRSDVRGSNDASSFEEFREFFHLECDNPSGSTGILRWTPQYEMPSLVYYQSFSRINTGFTIRVNGKPSVAAHASTSGGSACLFGGTQGLMGVLTMVAMATINGRIST